MSAWIDVFPVVDGGGTGHSSGPAFFERNTYYRVPGATVRERPQDVCCTTTPSCQREACRPLLDTPCAGACSASSLVRQLQRGGRCIASQGLRAPTPRPTVRRLDAANVIAVGSRPGGFRAVPGPHDQPCAGWMRVNLIAVEWRPGACGAPGPGPAGETSALPPSLSPRTPVDQPCAGWMRGTSSRLHCDLRSPRNTIAPTKGGGVTELERGRDKPAGRQEPARIA